MAKMNQKKFETQTEAMVRDKLRKKEYYDNKKIIVEEQHSTNPVIDKLLQKASKTGKGGSGKPEFIIQHKEHNHFIIVYELKIDINKHESRHRMKYAEYAVDGVLNYAAHLSKQYDVIAIAISGDKKNYKMDTFIWPQSGKKAKQLKDTIGNKITEITTFKEYVKYARFNHEFKKAKKEELLAEAKKLHNYMRDKCKLSESEKPLLVSGGLLALRQEDFRNEYMKYSPEKLGKKTYGAIAETIEDAVMPNVKKEHMKEEYTFIKKHPALIKDKNGEIPLKQILYTIDTQIRPFNDGFHDVDTVGEFYKEFLRYVGGDKQGLGIVLTPNHVTELFADLANVNKNDVVLDNGCGTGGFLVSSMHRMYRNTNKTERKDIRKNRLIGVEQQLKMFTLAASNMLLRGDGKANLYRGDCFDDEITKKIRKRANKGLMNPPYSQKGEDLHELFFVEHLLDCLKVNGTGIVIVPMSVALEDHPLKEKILKKHRLEAVMSMPDNLFYPVGVITCIMVFTAHVPHHSDESHKTWFGYWKDDGFELKRHKGRDDWNDQWREVKNHWLKTFRNREVIPGYSVLEKVGTKDEWCAEAYMETDYSDIKPNDFVKELKKYVLFKELGETI